MRENWERATGLIEFSRAELDCLVAAAFPNKTVECSDYARGGLANTNIRVKLSGSEQQLLLRVFVRDPDQARKECKISELIAGSVPSPRLVYFSPSNPVTGHPYLIREWIDGSRLEEAAPGVKLNDRARLAKSLGATLAAIHSHTFPSAGFFDGDLKVVTPVNLGSSGLLEYTHQCLIEESGGKRLGEELAAQLIQFVEREATLLDEWTGTPCLTHSDFGGSNIVVSCESTGWTVAAVLDWEFAFSGSPFFDFGNLLRPPLGLMEGFEESVREGYIASGGQLPEAWRRMSLLADLTAWLEFLTRPNAGDGVITTARTVVSTTIANWQA